MLYPMLRNLLFQFDAERTHHLTLSWLKNIHATPLKWLAYTPPVRDPYTVCGIRFPNRVGLAAGLDKNGDYIDALGFLGFGFVELGTVTPRPQPGNPQPRLFRLPEAGAIINRMGFNNKGVEHLVANVKAADYQGIIGINIGKNFDTPVEKAVDDYVYCLDKVYAVADYITVNISSPNTQGLRNLQHGDFFQQLLSDLKQRQQALAEQHKKYVPLFVKIAPDLSETEISAIAQALTAHQIDGVIATNTTLDREAVAQLPHAEEAGGLSGVPVRDKSTQVIRQLRSELGDDFPIIGVGGIDSGEAACEKIAAGANLVQLYSGLIYQGPKLVKRTALAIKYAE